MNEQMNYADEINIDLKDLFIRILKKWKFIVLCAVLAAGVFLAVFGLKEHHDRIKTNEFINEYNLDEPYYTYTVANKAKDLIPDENQYDTSAITLVEEAVTQNDSYQEQIEKLRKEIDDSLLYKLNGNTVSTLYTSYIIDLVTSEWEYLTASSISGEILNAFVDRLNSDDTALELIETLGIETEPKYIKSLYSMSTGTNLLRIKTLGDSREECEAMAEVINSIIEEITPEIKKAFPGYEFSFEYLAARYNEEDAGWIISSKNDSYNKIAEISKSQSDLTKNMTGTEKAMFDEIQTVKYISRYGTVEQFEELYGPEKSLIDIKMIVIGFILGGFLACAWVCMKYILSGKLRTADDLKLSFGLYDAETKENVMALAAKKGYEKICVLGTAKDRLGIESAEISDADAAVFAEEIDVSRYEDIEKEIRRCEQFGVPVLGYVVFKS